MDKYLATRCWRLCFRLGSDSSDPDCDEDPEEQCDLSSSPSRLARFFRLNRRDEEPEADDGDPRKRRRQNCRVGGIPLSLLLLLVRLEGVAASPESLSSVVLLRLLLDMEAGESRGCSCVVPLLVVPVVVVVEVLM